MALRLLLFFASLIGSAVVLMMGSDGRAGESPPRLFVAPGGADTGQCSRSAPCASLRRAYAVAAPGDTIQIAGGTYTSQTIEFRSDRRNSSCSPANTSACITFVPAPSAKITIDGNVDIYGSAVRWLGTKNLPDGRPTRDRIFSTRVTGYVAVESSSNTRWPDHVVLDGISTGNVLIGGSDYVVLRNMDVGPSTLDWNGRCTRVENRIGANGGYIHEPRFVTLERVLVHNQNRTRAAADKNCHYGGLFLVSGSDIAIRNSVFSQNVVYNIQVQNFGGGSNPSNVTVENNWFGCPVENLYAPSGETTCDGQADIQFAAALSSRNWLFRFNSLGGGGIAVYTPGASFENVRILANVGRKPPCLTGVLYQFNAWVGRQTCGSTDVALPQSPFSSTTAGQENFTLVRGSRASTFVAGSGPDFALATDIDGRLRPVRSRRDAGASQREDAAIVLGRSIGSARIGMKRAALDLVYGAPTRARAGALGAQEHRVRTFDYRVPGGIARVSTNSEETVVAVSTRSPYYSTWTGVGPGAALTGRSKLGQALWMDCLEAFRQVVRGRVVQLHADAKRRKVTRVAIYARSYNPVCTR